MKEETVRGKLDEILPAVELSHGSGKKGKWTLYGATLVIDGKDYTITAFSESIITENIKDLNTGENIECTIELNDKGFWNIKQGSIKKIGQQELSKLTECKPVPEKTNIPSVKDLAREAEPVASILLDCIKDDPKLTLKARCTAFRELMLDRRTSQIQEYKQNNMKNFRRG